MPRSQTAEIKQHTGSLPALPGSVHDISALETLLAEGWQIEPPVLVRPSWSQQRTGSVDYHFILRCEQRRSLVVIIDSAEVRQFLADHALTI